jgi:phosphatidylserine/phosphatidylglycerophosphate/cardiolipin synthase-like enzyme
MARDPFASVKGYFSPGRDCVETVTGFITRTRKTLDCAVFSLTNPDIIEALLAAVKRGVKVRMVTDKDQYAQNPKQREAVAALQGVAVEVRIDRQSGYMHNKYAISDYGQRGSAILCGSFNWTKNAVKRNRESLIRLRVKPVIAQFQQNFETVWAANVPK